MLPKLSEEAGSWCLGGIRQDAEALRELVKDAKHGEREDVPEVAPILMREKSKKAREGGADDVSKDVYEKVPVEAFGLALLRGMGYDPEKHKTKPIYHDKQRDALLGLGAQPLLPSEKMKQKDKKGEKKEEKKQEKKEEKEEEETTEYCVDVMRE